MLFNNPKELYKYPDVKHVLHIWRTSYKWQTLLTFRERPSSPRVLVGSVLLIFLDFCAVLCFCVLFVVVLCIVFQILPVSLDSPLLISPFGFLYRL